MKIHTILPKSGNAKKIWLALSPEIKELHYNANCWGKAKEQGYGTWACQFSDGGMYLCGIKNGKVYIQTLTAPYTIQFVEAVKDEEVKE